MGFGSGALGGELTGAGTTGAGAVGVGRAEAELVAEADVVVVDDVLVQENPPEIVAVRGFVPVADNVLLDAPNRLDAVDGRDETCGGVTPTVVNAMSDAVEGLSLPPTSFVGGVDRARSRLRSAETRVESFLVWLSISAMRLLAIGEAASIASR